MSSTSSIQFLQESAAEWCARELHVQSIAEAEQAVLDVSRRLAESMMAAAVKKLEHRATYAGPSLSCECGGRARFVGYRKRWIRTMCGDVQVSRSYYHCNDCHTGITPWDSDQGLGERIWSPGVKSLVGEMCARLTYSEVSHLLERVLGFGVEESSQQDIVLDLGRRMRGVEVGLISRCFDEEEVIVPELEAKRLYVCIDAAKAHTDGAWHDIKTGVVFAGEPKIGESGRIVDQMVDARYVAAQETSELFGRRIYLRALLSGLERAGQVVVLGDGAEWIWNTAGMHFSGCTEILDYYHACEHIWKLSGVIYGEGSDNGKRWAETHCHRLKQSGPGSLLRALKRRKGKTAAEKEALRVEQGYFQEHKKRMNYPKYLSMGLMIGSGPVESACKIVVGQRLKQAGMRWTRQGADAILALRTAVLSGQAECIQRVAKAA
jgi:hypothetical protein